MKVIVTDAAKARLEMEFQKENIYLRVLAIDTFE